MTALPRIKESLKETQRLRRSNTVGKVRIHNNISFLLWSSCLLFEPKESTEEGVNKSAITIGSEWENAEMKD